MNPTRILLTLLGFAFLCFISDCRKKPKPPQQTPLQIQAEKLAGTWDNATIIDVPLYVDTMIVKDLAMTFNIDNNHQPTAFSSSGAPDFFQTISTSTWSFSGNDSTVIIFHQVAPVKSIQISILNSKKLYVKFEKTSSLRPEDTNGKYEVYLSR